MEDNVKLPFLSGVNRRSGSLRIQNYVYVITKSKILFYFAFVCCIPWTLLYSLFEAIIGMWNVRHIKSRTKPKFKLAVVAIAKNESEYIAEWLAFNIANGVEQIYLYDNDSTDTMPEILEKFVDKGYVTYNQIHGELQQGNAYNDAIKRYSKECKYMAFIDCDEYLQTVDSTKSILSEVDRLLAGNNAKAGVAVNWVMYGSSNFENKPEGMCFESFIMRAKAGKKGTDVIKTIVRPECVKSYDHPHVPVYYPGFYSVNTEGKRLDFWSNPVEDYYSLRLNHYFTKSKEQWIIRRSMKRADTGTTRTLNEFYEHDNNDVVDTSALVHLDEVHAILNDVFS